MKGKSNIYLPLALTGVAIGINELWPNTFTQALVIVMAAITIYIIVKSL
jgi:hypothetical protein